MKKLLLITLCPMFGSTTILFAGSTKTYNDRVRQSKCLQTHCKDVAHNVDFYNAKIQELERQIKVQGPYASDAKKRKMQWNLDNLHTQRNHAVNQYNLCRQQCQ